MRKIKKRIVIFIITVLVLISFVFIGVGVAFDGNDYGGGGGGDYGGFDYGSSGDSSLSIGTTYIIGLIIFVIIVGVAIISTKRDIKRGKQCRYLKDDYGTDLFLPDRGNQIQKIIRRKDPNFTADDFVTFATQVYMDIQTAWCGRDMTPVKNIMHQNLFNSTQKQVEEKKKQGVVYHYENIAANTAYLTSYVRDKKNEYLTVYLNVRMFSYQTDEKTGNIVQENKTAQVDTQYKMKFVRSANAVTKGAVSGSQGYNCHNCGVLLNITSSIECPYCGSIVNIVDYSWLLSDFTTVQGNTVDEGIRVHPEYLQ